MRRNSGRMVRVSGVVPVRGHNLCLDIPDAAGIELKPFADRGRVRVAGRLDGADFNATLMPVKPAGHVLYLSGGLRAATGLNAGDFVVVDVQPEPAGQVTPPGDLALALHSKAGAAQRWSQLPAGERRELVRFIEDARCAGSNLHGSGRLKH